MDVQLTRIGKDLVATVRSALADEELSQLRAVLIEQVRTIHPRGVIVDVTVLDVMDSFAAGLLRDVSRTTQHSGVHTIVVGIQPGVAFAMVQLGLHYDAPMTALDVEEAQRLLDHLQSAPPP